jgi:hypothetical protein
MFQFDGGILIPLAGMAIPIVAIVGGISAGIMRMVLKQRVLEMAQRERIAAIEKGLDISQLPPLPSLSDDDDNSPLYMSPRQAALRRSRGLMIGGLVTLAAGIGVALMLGINHDETGNWWSVGLIPG